MCVCGDVLAPSCSSSNAPSRSARASRSRRSKVSAVCNSSTTAPRGSCSSATRFRFARFKFLTSKEREDYLEEEKNVCLLSRRAPPAALQHLTWNLSIISRPVERLLTRSARVVCPLKAVSAHVRTGPSRVLFPGLVSDVSRSRRRHRVYAQSPPHSGKLSNVHNSEKTLVTLVSTLRRFARVGGPREPRASRRRSRRGEVRGLPGSGAAILGGVRVQVRAARCILVVGAARVVARARGEQRRGGGEPVAMNARGFLLWNSTRTFSPQGPVRTSVERAPKTALSREQRPVRPEVSREHSFESRRPKAL